MDFLFYIIYTRVTRNFISKFRTKVFILLIKMASLSIMILVFFFFIFSVANFSHGSTDKPTIEDRYVKWLARHGHKSPSTRFKRTDDRFEIYKSNVQFIDAFNSQNHSFTLIDNKFADMTKKEFRELVMGSVKRENRNIGERGKIILANTSRVTQSPSVDWRRNGAVGPIKDQLECGTFIYLSTI